MREKRKTAWKQLTVAERDVLTVLAAVCKVSQGRLCVKESVPKPTATSSTCIKAKSSMGATFAYCQGWQAMVKGKHRLSDANNLE